MVKILKNAVVIIFNENAVIRRDPFWTITFFTKLLRNPFRNHFVDKTMGYRMVLERDSEEFCEESYGPIKVSSNHSVLLKINNHSVFLRS